MGARRLTGREPGGLASEPHAGARGHGTRAPVTCVYSASLTWVRDGYLMGIARQVDAVGTGA